MNINLKSVATITTYLICIFILGCVEPGSTEKAPGILEFQQDLGLTIGSLAEVFSLETIPVKGYGIVGGLRGTGSSECDPALRAELKKYILRQAPKINIEKFISSSDTAVVAVEGIMSPSAAKNRYFDLKVTALSGTQTTSLAGGWLYRAELNVQRRTGRGFKILAYAEGGVFIDTIDEPDADKRMGYILGGGTVIGEYNVRLTLRQPDYKTANLIRNRLNQRFGYNIAKAATADEIDLKVPDKYKSQKQKFVSIVKATYLNYTPQATKERIMTFVRKLGVSDNKQQSEIVLEAIGNKSVNKLAALLNSSNEEVRLRAARCMLNLGSNRGLETLRKIAMDKNSQYRFEVIDAVTTAANRNDAAVLSKRLLKDENFDIRLAAYESLRKLDDVAITQTAVARSFYLEQTAQTQYNAIYVSRSGEPRIVLFGAPLYCIENIFVQSEDKNVTINAPSGQKYVSITRKLPGIAPFELRSSYKVSDIIRTLSEEPKRKAKQGQIGLEVSYSETIAILKQMCDKGAIKATFHAGPMPKIGLNIKK